MQQHMPLLRRLPRQRLSSVRVCLEPFDIDSVDDSGAREELGMAADDTVFINVGRLTEQKGLTYLLRAAKIVVASHPESKFVIVGDGLEGERLKAEARELGLSDHVIFTGFRRDVLRLLKMSDVFVLSSLYEGMPKALLEAMMAKLACLSTGIFGIPELIGDTGILVPPGDVDALAKAMLELAKDPALRERLGDAAKLRVETEFSQTAMMAKIEAIYDEVLARG
jgi:glycosyltransferase involved in cell wall biosynthesis